jgi:threonine dehydratase
MTAVPSDPEGPAEEITAAIAEEIERATTRLRGRIRRTPVLHTDVPTPEGYRPVALKLEQTQLSGSFKARGILNAALHADEKGRLGGSGLVIASGGNAGIAAAVAGRILDVPATVAVPRDAPEGKLVRLRELGARIMGDHADHAATNSWADDFASEHGALRLHAYDLPDVIAGAGTLAREAREQAPGTTAILVAVGGGGLVAGTLLAAAGTGMRTVAVEPVGAPTLHATLQAGEAVEVEVDTIAKDSLGAARLGAAATRICLADPPESVLVTDAEITAAKQWLWVSHRLLVENAGACALAALMSGAWAPAEDDAPMLVLCGANVDLAP